MDLCLPPLCSCSVKLITWILGLIPFSASPFFIGCSLNLLASSTRFSAVWYLLITQSLFSQHSHFIPLPDFRLLSHPKKIAISSLFSAALHLNIFSPVSLWLKLSTHWVPISTLIVFCKLVITSLSTWSIFSLSCYPWSPIVLYMLIDNSTHIFLLRPPNFCISFSLHGFHGLINCNVHEGMLYLLCNHDKQYSYYDIADNSVFVVKQYCWRKGRVRAKAGFNDHGQQWPRKELIWSQFWVSRQLSFMKLLFRVL